MTHEEKRAQHRVYEATYRAKHRERRRASGKPYACYLEQHAYASADRPD